MAHHERADSGSGLIRFPTSINTQGNGANDDREDPLLNYSEPPSPIIEDPADVAQGSSLGKGSWPRRAALAWRRLVLGPQRQPRYRSGYLTLIPLSDARLQPRRTRLVIGLSMLLSLLAAVGVFLGVPRGISVGTLEMHSIRMHFNASTMNYRIVLGAKVPVLNPNYFQSRISGNLSISFYDAPAGWKDFGPIEVPPRSFPSVVRVKVDASNLPGKYTAVVIGCCLNFPRRLIFFLTADFKVHYMMWSYDLPLVDSYFMLDCNEANGGWPAGDTSYDGDEYSDGDAPAAYPSAFTLTAVSASDLGVGSVNTEAPSPLLNTGEALLGDGGGDSAINSAGDVGGSRSLAVSVSEAATGSFASDGRERRLRLEGGAGQL